MQNLKIDKLNFSAPSGTIHASLIYSAVSANEMAVVVPGAGYSCKMPLLYYSIDSMLLKGYRVLAIEKIYAEDVNWREFKTRDSAFKYVEDDTIEVFAQISKIFGDRVKLFLGRSLGTFQIACAMERHLFLPRQVIWQTPSLVEKWSIMNSCGVAGFGIVGTIDDLYETALPYLPKDRIVIEGADHAMEIPSNPLESIDVLKKVIYATSDWIIPASHSIE